MTAERDFIPLQVCVLTVSDTRTAENDTSGDWLCDALREAGHRLHERAISRDDRYAMRAIVLRPLALATSPEATTRAAARTALATTPCGR